MDINTGYMVERGAIVVLRTGNEWPVHLARVAHKPHLNGFFLKFITTGCVSSQNRRASLRM